ncbi:MAG: TrkA C-terminal domain-containing protein [Planctomycetota bacterium]|nr:TrkA C-terminal domain-containing protein [Planctomycetota bacterium]
MSVISLPLVGLILLVVGITVLVVKAGAMALRLTGMEARRADFQALSAVTGTGFTTREAELVMADPRRRRIVSALMIFGNVVLVTVVGLMVGSFASAQEQYEVPLYGLVLVLGVFVVYRVLTARGVVRRWDRWVDEHLGKRLRLKEHSFAEMLTLAPGYGVAELRIDPASPFAGKTLARSGLREAGLLVLAVRRDEKVLPAPAAEDVIRSGDSVICYGDLERMHKLVHEMPEDAAPAGPASSPDDGDQDV